MYRALYDYAGVEDNANVLALTKGQQLVLLERIDDEWARVQATDHGGESGIVPQSYLKTAEEALYPIYVARKAATQINGAGFATMGEKVEVLHEMSCEEWYVRHLETKAVGCVQPKDFLPVSDGDEDDPDTPVRDMTRRLTNRFVVERSSARSRTKSRSSGGGSASNASTPVPLQDSGRSSSALNNSTSALDQDAELRSSTPSELKTPKRKSLRMRLSFRSKDSKQKTAVEKEERRHILQELDSTISTFKASKSLCQKAEVKELLTTMQKMRNDVYRGRDLEKARAFIKKDSENAAENGPGMSAGPGQALPSTVSAAHTEPFESDPFSPLPCDNDDGGQKAMSSASSLPTIAEPGATTPASSHDGASAVSHSEIQQRTMDRSASPRHVSPTSLTGTRSGSGIVKPPKPKTAPPPPPPGVAGPSSAAHHQQPLRSRAIPECTVVPAVQTRGLAVSQSASVLSNTAAAAAAASTRNAAAQSTKTSKSASTLQAPPPPQSSTNGLGRTLSQPAPGYATRKVFADALRSRAHSSPGSRESSSKLVRLAHQVMGSPANSPKETARRLVEDVRVRAGSSFDNSCLAAVAVLDNMRDYLPDKVSEIDELLEAVQQLQSASETDGSKETKDATRLDVIFSELTTMRNDAQQRNWQVHDDDEVISEYLEELLSILADADQAMCAAKVAADDYAFLSTLAEYYQMESRVNIRMLLLKLFGGLCSLDQKIPPMLLYTNLPLELARDIKVDTSEFQKTLYSCLVATMMFSCGEKPPVGYYETWNVEFVLFLLDLVENPSEEDEDEQLLDCALSVVLAFNYHFLDIDVSDNFVMKALQSSPSTRNFCEKVLLIFNREEDPVALGKPLVPDSMLKLLKDMFAERSTASLFYTSDTHVLIDIVARQLNDLPEGSELRYHYLLLLEELVQTTDFNAEQHGRGELATALARIEEGEVVEDRHRDTIARIRTLAPCLANA